MLLFFDHHHINVLSLTLHQLVLVKVKLIDVFIAPRVAAAADMDAALMILHLLLGFKSLFAFDG